jgi:hypothetical protein
MRKIILICLVLIVSVCLNDLVSSFPLSNKTSEVEDQNQFLTDLENENEYAYSEEEKLNDQSDQNVDDENGNESKYDTDVGKKWKENYDLDEIDEDVTDKRVKNSIFKPFNEDDDSDYRDDKINNEVEEEKEIDDELNKETNGCETKLNDQNNEDQKEAQIDTKPIIQFPIQLSYDTVQTLKKLFN